jgi:hypothetical protein
MMNGKLDAELCWRAYHLTCGRDEDRVGEIIQPMPPRTRDREDFDRRVLGLERMDDDLVAIVFDAQSGAVEQPADLGSAHSRQVLAKKIHRSR